MIVINFVYKILVFLFFTLLLLTVNCEDYENRTYAGKEINIRRVPYTVHLTPVGCTGALIHPQWVLTAGHCVVDESLPDTYVILGSSDSRFALNHIKVVNAYLHPNYLKAYTNPDLGESAKCDLALVKLQRPARLSQYVQLLQLDTGDWPHIKSRTCMLTGYGKNIYGNTKMHYSQLHVETECGCLSDITVLCATAFKAGDSPCYGDSGSVMVCDNKGVAVTSQAVPQSYCFNTTAAMEEIQGNVCGKSNFLYLFTKLQPNFLWFDRVLSDNTDITNRASELRTVQCYLRSSSFQITVLLITMLLYFW